MQSLGAVAMSALRPPGDWRRCAILGWLVVHCQGNIIDWKTLAHVINEEGYDHDLARGIFLAIPSAVWVVMRVSDSGTSDFTLIIDNSLIASLDFRIARDTVPI